MCKKIRQEEAKKRREEGEAQKQRKAIEVIE